MGKIIEGLWQRGKLNCKEGECYEKVCGNIDCDDFFIVDCRL